MTGTIGEIRLPQVKSSGELNIGQTYKYYMIDSGLLDEYLFDVNRIPTDELKYEIVKYIGKNDTGSYEFEVVGKDYQHSIFLGEYDFEPDNLYGRLYLYEIGPKNNISSKSIGGRKKKKTIKKRKNIKKKERKSKKYVR